MNNNDTTKHLQSFTKKEYIAKTGVSEIEFTRRYKDGQLKKIGAGAKTLYIPTQKHLTALIDELREDLAKDNICIKKCDGHCKDQEKKCKDDGYAAVDKVDLVVERRKNLFQRIFSR